MKDGLVKYGDAVNCRDCFYGSTCNVARGHNYKIGECKLFTPIETKTKCPLCGGTLSEIREQNGRKWRHCYSCHLEQEISPS